MHCERLPFKGPTQRGKEPSLRPHSITRSLNAETETGKSHKAIVERERGYNGFVALAAFLELFHVEAAILVFIHHAEDLLNSLLRCVFISRELHHGSDLGLG